MVLDHAKLTQIIVAEALLAARIPPCTMEDDAATDHFKIRFKFGVFKYGYRIETAADEKRIEEIVGAALRGLGLDQFDLHFSPAKDHGQRSLEVFVLYDLDALDERDAQREKAP